MFWVDPLSFNWLLDANDDDDDDDDDDELESTLSACKAEPESFKRVVVCKV